MKKCLISLIVIVFLISCGVSKEEKEKIEITMLDMKSIGMAMELYSIDYIVYPENIEQLHPYIENPPTSDAWRNEFVYKVSSDKQNYELISKGPDGKLNTEDDIVFSMGLFTKSP